MRAGLWVVMTAGAGMLAGCGLAAAAVDDTANPARLGAWTLKPELVSMNAGGQTIGRDKLAEMDSDFSGLAADGPFGSRRDRSDDEQTASCYEPGVDAKADIREVLNRGLIENCTVTDETREGNTRRAVLTCPYERFGSTGKATIATTARLDADAANTDIRISLDVQKSSGATERMTLRFEVKATRTGDCGSS
ncbi:MAG TPA: DUF3617 family protein [Sphingomonas sp.]|jgi:hypothetical protein